MPQQQNLMVQGQVLIENSTCWWSAEKRKKKLSFGVVGVGNLIGWNKLCSRNQMDKLLMNLYWHFQISMCLSTIWVQGRELWPCWWQLQAQDCRCWIWKLWSVPRQNLCSAGPHGFSLFSSRLLWCGPKVGCFLLLWCRWPLRRASRGDSSLYINSLDGKGSQVTASP